MKITDGVQILAPKFQAKEPSAVPHVGVHRSASLNDNDRSVFDIAIANYTTVDGNLLRPIYSDLVKLAGLEITGGDAVVGGGIHAEGFMTLEVEHCLITGMTLEAVSGKPDTKGGGIAAMGIDVPNTVDPKGDHVRYGPIVKVTNSEISGNATPINDETQNVGIDQGGGIFVDSGGSLTLINSKVAGNSAENGGGGIYFGGGQFYENPLNGNYKLFTTSLEIFNSSISDNSAASAVDDSSGGGLTIAGPTMAMIGSSTFASNTSRHHGGGIFITSDNAQSTSFVGSVFIVASTFEANIAANDSEQKSSGNGGGLAINTIFNRTFVVNSTFSANKTLNG